MQGQMDLFSDGFLKTETQKKVEEAQQSLFDMAKPKETPKEPTLEEFLALSTGRNNAPKEPKEPKKETAKIIEFPKPVETVKPKDVKGSATYEDCKKKFASDLEKFKDADSQYVINGLLELCKVDKDFCNRVMQKSKSYEGAYEYMAEMAQKGIGAYKVGNNMAIMEKDSALGICINYYNE